MCRIDVYCSGTFILGGTDEIQALLDDQIVKTQAMRASPYIKPLEAQAAKWETMLVTLQVRHVVQGCRLVCSDHTVPGLNVQNGSVRRHGLAHSLGA